jgi:phage repressor protein C with HTH and peptisase S24 domain/DNA-binding XRE family transcriptional regulator
MSDIEIRTKLRTARDQQGLSLRRAAALIGISHSMLAKIENGARRLDSSCIRKVAPIYGLDPEVLLASLDAGGSSSPVQSRKTIPAERGNRNLARTPMCVHLPGEIPIRCAAGPGADQILRGLEGPLGTTKCPPELDKVAGGYALIVVGDSMEPAFQSGHTAFVYPHHPLFKGCYGVFILNDGKALLRRLVVSDHGRFVLEQFNPPSRMELPWSEVSEVGLVTSVRFDR